MRFLYGGFLTWGSTTEHRLRAFRRAVAPDALTLPYECYLEHKRFPLLHKIADRLQRSPGITALNAALIDLVERNKVDYLWLDKPIYFHPQTIERVQRRGTRVIAYMPDDPFGPRNDIGWRQFKAALPHYFAHVVPREVTRREFLQRGATRVACVPFAFEPTVHFPAGALGVMVPKDYDVSFIGTPHDERLEWILRLARELPDKRLGLFGDGWRRHRTRLQAAGLKVAPPVWNDRYRDVIWRSRLSLSFVTRSNRDELSHKALEIAACGSCVLLEPSPLHNRVFRERESAFFFDSPLQLSHIVGEALAHEEQLRHVASGGAKAVRAAGLSNDEVLCSALRQLGVLPAESPRLLKGAG
jgi:hypothetical protein